MEADQIDFGPLRRAIDRLTEAVQQVNAQPDNDLLRDGCIQRFEFTFELAAKLLRRYLEATEPVAETVSELSYSGLIRLADARGLLRGGLPVWQNFRTSRNISAHTYDQPLALRVFAVIPSFIEEVEHLFQRLNPEPR